MNDTTSIDMGPFLERHNRRARAVFIATTSVSLILSAVIFICGTSTTGAADSVLESLWRPIVTGPLMIIVLWVACALYTRKNPLPADGRAPMNVDDARNVRRVANAGTVFVVGFNAAMIAGQAVWLLSMLGVLPPSTPDSSWNVRASLVVMGALSIYFGNVSPRMPTPRAPEAKPAVRMKYNRLTGWTVVVFGASLAVAGLFLPFQTMLVTVVVANVSMVLALAIGTVMYRQALKTPSAP